jgi:hypothetical protein
MCSRLSAPTALGALQATVQHMLTWAHTPLLVSAIARTGLATCTRVGTAASPNGARFPKLWNDRGGVRAGACLHPFLRQVSLEL